MSRRSSRVGDVVIGIWVFAAVVAAFLLYRQFNPPPPPPPELPSQAFDPNRAYELWPADSDAVALTPDGTAAIFPLRRGGLESLRYTILDGSYNARELAAPAAIRYRSLMYSPDAQWIYAVVSSAGDERAWLQRQPAKGGVPQRIADDVFGFPAVSADNTRLAFLSNLADGSGAVQVADMEGRSPRQLFSRAVPMTHDDGVAWSPDGAMLVVPGVEGRSLQVIDSQAGEPRATLLDGLQQFCGAAWPPRGFIVACAARPGASPSRQLFAVEYPGGEPREISDNSYDHRGARMSADGRVFATAARGFSLIMSIHTVGSPDRTITHGTVREAKDLPRDPSWRPDGKIALARGPHIITIESNGPNVSPATGGPTEDRQPVVTPDGKYLVFESYGDTEPVLWRAELATGAVMELRGGPSIDPTVSRDSRWVYWVDESQRIWRISIDGGTPEMIYATPAETSMPAAVEPRSATWPKISPDGQWVARAVRSGAGERYGRFEVVPTAGGLPRTFSGEVDLSLWHAAAWSADGRTFLYAHEHASSREAGFGLQYAGKVWAQDITAAFPRLLLAHTEGPLTDMAVSYDLSRILLIKGGPELNVEIKRDP